MRKNILVVWDRLRAAGWSPGFERKPSNFVETEEESVGNYSHVQWVQLRESVQIEIRIVLIDMGGCGMWKAQIMFSWRCWEVSIYHRRYRNFATHAYSSCSV